MKRNDLCADIGYQSLCHDGEQLCGDRIEVVGSEGDTTVIVLADGLGSGVKANILSTLTCKIISTMVASGLPLEDAVETIAQTLPVCSVRGIAYSTFTVIRMVNNERADIMQYDNPELILLRDGKHKELSQTIRQIGGKSIRHSELDLREGDLFILMSDGVEHAGVGRVYNFGWKRSDIIDFLETIWDAGFTAKTVTTLLLKETNRLYEGRPGDDASVCTVRIRRRESVNLLIGPPSNRDDCGRMMALFFGKEGKHIVCGGTTSEIAAQHLKKPVTVSMEYLDPEIPPTAKIEGVELVTEGVITMNRVLEYAKDALGENRLYEKWSFQRDGASRIARMLFEEATDINFFVGCAVNPAHQNPDLPIHFNMKMRLVDELAECLRKMGKRIKVNYF